MTDTPAEKPAPQAIAVRPQREVRVVDSDNPVMSTAGFEHLIRVATVMGESGMMSQTLTHSGTGNNLQPLPEKVVIARAFIIAEFAARIDESPISVMQCASFVHGKLMLEGKFVDAMLEAKFGIKTKKEFGKWDASKEKTILGEEGQGDQLGIIVSGIVNGEREEVHGYVGGWKTTGNGSPWKPGSMRKMLGNRGVREFARIHEAGAILGIIGIAADDEYDQTNEAPASLPRGRKADLKGRLQAPKEDETSDQAQREGFSHAHVERETSEQKKAEDQTERAADAEAAGADPKTGELPKEEPKTVHEGELLDADGSVVEKDDDNAQDEPADVAGQAEAEKAPEDTPKPPEGPLGTFWNIVQAAETWADVKKGLTPLFGSDDWLALDDEEADAYRAKTWEEIKRRNIKIDQAVDPSAFRLWMVTQRGPEGADAVQGTLAVLQGESIFAKLSDNQRNGFLETVHTWIATERAS